MRTSPPTVGNGTLQIMIGFTSVASPKESRLSTIPCVFRTKNERVNTPQSCLQVDDTLLERQGPGQASVQDPLP